MKPDNSERNKRICKLLKSERLSYAVIAEMIGTTRYAVSGVVFRKRHQGKIRGCSPNGSGYNKIGTGYRLRTYYPEKTVLNTR